MIHVARLCISRFHVLDNEIVDDNYTSKHLGTILVSGMIAVRFVAAPLFLYTFLNDLATWTLCIFVFAVSTDALDGYVARRVGGVSIPFLGPYSDATADFILILAAFWAFWMEDLYPFWVLPLFILMFAQFVLTSRLDRPIYDPVGKYYGFFLFGAIGVTLVLPDTAVCHAVLIGILGFTAAVVISRSLFLLGLWKNRAQSHNIPDP